MHLNFNHLYYFWAVVREGGVSAAAQALHLTPQTISGQIKQLQSQFPEPLLLRAGRGLQLSPLGERVFEQADAMFAETEALFALTERRPTSSQRRLRIGAADVLPKLVVRRLLAPALRLQPRPLLQVREVDLRDLLDDLAHRRLDAVIADRPVASAGHARADARLVLTTKLALYAAEPLATRLAADFPHSLDGAPALLPRLETYARRLLDQWFHRHGLRPDIVGELDDSALVNSFGEEAFGFFAAPADQAPAIARQHGARCLGLCEGAEERFYVITLAEGPVNQMVSAWLAAWPAAAPTTAGAADVD